MSDISRRRRFAGRALVCVAVLALPLTASITYADVPAAPLPPDPPAPLAADAPPAPPPPHAPEAPAAGEGHRTMVWRTAGGEGGEHELKREFRDGDVVFMSDGKKLSEAEFEAKMEAFGARMEGLGEELEPKLKDMPEIDKKRIRAIERRAERIAAHAPEVRMTCEGDAPTSAITTPEGKRIIRICERRLMSKAVIGLRQAREQIAANVQMSEEVRREVLRSLDHEIARLEAVQ